MRHQHTTSATTLKKNRLYELQQKKFGYSEDNGYEFFVIGDRVWVDGSRPASVAYFGETEFGQGDWLGVVLDDPTGFHDGRLHGRSYFQCAPYHGLFVRPSRATRMSESNQASRSSSNRSTPLSRASRCSVDSYFYDEDYRIPRVDAKSLHTSSNRRSLDVDQGPRGILKHNQMDRHSPNWIADKTEELAERLERIQKISPRSPVYQFRPARVNLPPVRSSSLGRHHDTAVNLVREPIVGERIKYKRDGREVEGILRFLGFIDCASGLWAGIELDWPEGNSDGSLAGRRYFFCRNNYGTFVPARQLQMCQESVNLTKTLDPKSLRSTVISPPPLTTARPSSASSYSQSSSKGSSTCSPYTPDLAHVPHERRESPIRLRPGEIRPKFDESDIERELIKSLHGQQHKPLAINEFEPKLTKVTVGQNIKPAKPRAVQYTFTTTKHGGNPVAWRQIKY